MAGLNFIWLTWATPNLHLLVTGLLVFSSNKVNFHIRKNILNVKNVSLLLPDSFHTKREMVGLASLNNILSNTWKGSKVKTLRCVHCSPLSYQLVSPYKPGTITLHLQDCDIVLFMNSSWELDGDSFTNFCKALWNSSMKSSVHIIWCKRKALHKQQEELVSSLCHLPSMWCQVRHFTGSIL